MGNQHAKERKYHGRKIDWTKAECPSPPGKAYLVPEAGEKFSDVITIRWSPPTNDGGAPIKGYLVEHRRTGSPHWLRAIPHLVPGTELALTGLEPGWRYQFRVSAENELGRSNPGDLSEPLTVTSQKWAASAPYFNVPLQDKYGLENEKVEFRVQVIGVPSPTISWYKDGFEVFSGRRTKIVTENDQSIFIIHQAALEDEGEIKCAATNRAGHAVTKAILKLDAPPRIRLPRQYEDGLIFEKGELIKLKVTTAGRPKPEVFWYHNGEILQKNDRITIADSETGSVLKISDACRSNRGEYVVRGVNKIGEDVASILVTVTDRPLPPQEIQVTTIGRKVIISWASPDDDGGCKIGTYIVEYFRIGWDVWLKARNSRQLTATLDNLIEGSEYKFRVRAENPYGISDPSQESEVIFIPDPRRGTREPQAQSNAFDLLEETNQSAVVTENGEKNLEDKKRKLLEEKARQLLDTPLSELLPYNKLRTDKGRPESRAESVLSSEECENGLPVVPKRKKKSGRRLSPNLSESPSSSSLEPNFSPADVGLSESNENLKIKFHDPMTRTPETNKANGFYFEETETFGLETPIHPRENDDSIIHGSSELMLVIYPRERSKSADLSAQKRSEIEMNLKGDGIAPPMSLSAPELSSADALEVPPMRDAVSSTELLYERTVARLYKDAVEEEAQRTVKRRYSTDRKSVERRSSWKDSLLNRRHSFRGNEEDSKEQRLQDRNGFKNENDKTVELLQKISRTQRERLSSVEMEQREFARVRRKLKEKEESDGFQNRTDTSTTSSSLETDDLADDEEPDEESSYLEEIKTDTQDGNFEINDFLKQCDRYSLMFKGVTLLRPKSAAPFAEPEDDTYHPRSMIPTKSIFSKIEKIESGNTIKKSTALVTPNFNVKSDENPQIHPIPGTESKKRKKASKILKKLGLKRKEKIPQLTLTPADSDPSPPPKPILKNKNILKGNTRSISTLKVAPVKPSEKSVSEEESESEIPGRKKKVRIAEPEGDDQLPKKEPNPVDENAAETQVLIYHYSDIVKEFGGNKKPPARQFLNYQELRDHAKLTKGSDKLKTDEIKRSSENIRRTTEGKQKINERPGNAEPNMVNLPESNRTGSMPFEYATDVIMFILACWLYFFKNELYAIPVLCVMAYRQLKDITVENFRKLKNSILRNNTEKTESMKSNSFDSQKGELP